MNIEGLITASVRLGTPLLFATLGEIITERAGVLNLGLEGLMLVGALSGFATSYMTGNVWLAFIVALIAGGLFALIHAFMSITLRVNQVVSGLALTMLGSGISGVLGEAFVGKPAAKFNDIYIPGLSNIPVLGAFFKMDALVYLGYILVPVLYIIIFKTKLGLTLRAVGEEPSAADSRGINVFLVRYIATVVGGALTAAGGAYLSLAATSMWIENMSAGRGWIAVALVIFSAWEPFKALVGSYLFGFVMSLQLRLQAMGVAHVSANILLMLPYLITVLTMILFSFNKNFRNRVGAPSALSVPYSREEKM